MGQGAGGGLMRIRAATAAEVPGVLPMVRALIDLHESWDAARYGMVANAVEMYAQWLPDRATDPRSVFLVAEAGGGLAGFLVGTVEQSVRVFRVKEYGYIHDVWVQPGHRGAGVGRGLVAAAFDRFRALGVSQVRLETAWANDAARRVFRLQGFGESSVEMICCLGES